MKNLLAWVRVHRWMMTTVGVISGFVILILWAFVWGPRTLLYVNDDPQPGPGWIYVLMGDTSGERAGQTLRLVRSGVGNRVLLPQVKQRVSSLTGESTDLTAIHRNYLLQRGVSPNQVEVLEGCVVTSTWEEAICLRERIGKASAGRRVVVVTSWYHGGRARWLFRRALQDIPVVIRFSSTKGPDGHWWESEDHFLAVFNESLKFVYWWWRLPIS